jgi:hypothetical protein
MFTAAGALEHRNTQVRVSMMLKLVVALLFLICGACHAQTICDGGLRTLRFALNVTPEGISGSESAVKKVGKEGVYSINLMLPACSGKATVISAERGHKVSGGESGTNHWWSPNSGEGIVHGTSDAVHHTGASIRMSVDGKEICRINDGETVPPGPGAWNSASDFDNYRMVCAKKEYMLKAGAVFKVEVARWNINAEPDNFDFIVTFERTGS